MFRSLSISMIFIFLINTTYADVHPLPSGKPLHTCDFKSKSCNGTGYHLGTDLMAPVGTQVKAMCPGKVKINTTGRTDVRNAFLIIKHKCKSGNYYGYYGHISSDIGRNKKVKEGQVIGTVRKYGSNNHHLHMGIAKSYRSRGWGYGSSVGDNINFLTLLNNSNNLTSQKSEPSPPFIMKAHQRGRKVRLAWKLVNGGTNYRIQVAEAGNPWRPDSGFESPIINSTKFVKRSKLGSFTWRKSQRGRYQYSVRVNVKGVGASKFSRPVSFDVR